MELVFEVLSRTYLGESCATVFSRLSITTIVSEGLSCENECDVWKFMHLNDVECQQQPLRALMLPDIDIDTGFIHSTLELLFTLL
jgi:hypothetical protein